MAPQALSFSSTSEDAASAIRLQPCHGIPDDIDLAPSDVVVRFLAFPLNPQDLMAIAGKYPVKPIYSNPDGSHIAGNDGVARVERLGSAVIRLQVGDIVLPKVHGMGTWRESATFPSESLLRIPKEVDPVAAALLKMGFAPGYLLIEDMAPLHPGDWIVVNAALGVIPQMAIQFARLRGCHAVAVVRMREAEELEAARKVLYAQGASIVVTEDELAVHGSEADARLATAVKEGRIKLALDAVFGDSASRLVRLLGVNGTCVNYGSLGGADGILPLTQEALFWKQIKFRNFRLSQQLATRSEAQVEALLGWFVELLAQKHLTVPAVEEVGWLTGEEDSAALGSLVRETLDKAVKRAPGTKKQIFTLVGGGSGLAE